MVATLSGPHINFASLSPLIALFGGATVLLLVAVVPPFDRPPLKGRVEAVVALASLATALGLTIWQWHATRPLVAGALRIDRLAVVLDTVLLAGGAAAVLLAAGGIANRRRGGELYALLLSSIAGMFVLVGAQNTVVLFLGFELLSIPLYVLCAIERERERGLEAALKYLIIGSVGGATLLYGLALLYGATGATGYHGIAKAIQSRELTTNAMVLGGVALCVVGFAFKSSVAPFHQWTPDVYEGAPTPITTFMAVATKVAALGALLRLFDVALIDTQPSWGPALAVLATITIVVGNVGALGQRSLKRLLAFSAVAQAGYMLAGVVVSTQTGVKATVFYLAAYLMMNVAAFAVITHRERESDLGDGIEAVSGLGRINPLLAVVLTVAMLGLAGIPGTVGFMGKFYLIAAAAGNGYTWLGVVIVIGSMLSLGYYLPVVAAIWMRPSAPAAQEGPLPAIAGGSGERVRQPAVLTVAALAGAASLFFGVVPSPLFDLVAATGRALGLL